MLHSGWHLYQYNEDDFLIKVLFSSKLFSNYKYTSKHREAVYISMLFESLEEIKNKIKKSSSIEKFRDLIVTTQSSPGDKQISLKKLFKEPLSALYVRRMTVSLVYLTNMKQGLGKGFKSRILLFKIVNNTLK